MPKTFRKRICIVTHSLSGGGAEKSSAELSKILNDLGHEVFIVTVMPEVSYAYKGELLNLGEFKKEHNNWYSRIARFFKLKRFLNDNKIDFIIDSRSRVSAFREFVISKLVYKVKAIYMIHNYEEAKVFTKYAWLNTYLYKNQVMVAVSKAAEEKFKAKYNLKLIETIYNGFDFESIEQQSKAYLVKDENYILFYGRLDDKHKNLKLLLEAFSNSQLTKKGIKLIILGNGEDKEMLKKYAIELGLDESSVNFIGFFPNPYPYVAKALFTVLTSKHEGFPMVIPESLFLETPMVSVDCNSGPNEIIANEVNGLLVENDNVKALAQAFNRMINEKELYDKCKLNSKNTVEPFAFDKLKYEWNRLLKKVDN